MERISRYYEYISMFPKLFLQNDSLKIITDRKEIEEYALANHTDMGILFENNTFAVVVDLVENELGTRYASSRIINKNGYNGVVVIPVYEDKIVMLEQFRHGTRQLELELPRGFSEKGISPEDNAKKEIYEELGGEVSSIDYCGSIISDTGLTGGEVHVYICNIAGIGNMQKEEGIIGYRLLSLAEIDELIYKGVIRDSFTISAICKLKIFKSR